MSTPTDVPATSVTSPILDTSTEAGKMRAENRRRALGKKYSFLEDLASRPVFAKENGRSPLPSFVCITDDSSSPDAASSAYVLVFQGIRDGIGTSTVASAVAWQLAQRKSARVAALCTAESALGFRHLFNLPEAGADPQTGAFWRYGDHLLLRVPALEESATLETLRLQIDALSKKGVTHIVVDAGPARSPEAALWRSAADVFTTVLTADVNTILRAADHEVEPREVLLFNRVHPFSESDADAASFLRAMPHLMPYWAPKAVPHDEFAARAAFRRGPVTQLSPYAESAQTLAAFATWVTLRAERLRREATC